MARKKIEYFSSHTKQPLTLSLKYTGIILFIILVCNISVLHAQNFTTKGVEFWAGYGTHANMYNEDGSVRSDGGSQKMVFYFLSNKPTNVKVEIPAIGWVRTYVVTAGGVTETEEMPKAGADDSRLLNEGVSTKGIHITSDDKITAYCHIYDFHLSATSLLIPVNIAGQEYYSLNYKQRSYHPQGQSFCFVIATEDDTEIEVTPSVNTRTHTAGIPFTQKLNKGEILNLYGETYGKEGNSYTGADLTGTYVRVVNPVTNEPCKKIIMYSGSTSVNVMCSDAAENWSDNLIQQVHPLEAWGTNFILVPTAKMPLNKYRVMVLDARQSVYLNGVRLRGLINGRYYEFESSEVSNVFSDTLLMVAQYITTSGECGNTQAGDKTGDPEMIYLSPLGNGITSVIGNATTNFAATAHYINVVIKTNDVKSFTLDGQTIPEQFTVFSRNNNYSTAQIPIQAGRHVLQSALGFNAYAYGYGELESYGYNMGFSITHVNGDFGIINTYAIPPTPQACNDNPFRMYFDIAEKIKNLEWKFKGNASLQPNTDVFLTNVKPDSSYVKNNETYYRYYLPGWYTYAKTEQFGVDVLAYVPNRKGCITQKLFSFAVDVTPKPEANWALTYNRCANELLSFKNTSAKFTDFDFNAWIWNFGDGSASTEKEPQKQYADYGEYSTTLRAITTLGCYDDTAKLVGLYHRPVAAFIINGGICSGDDVYFTDASTIQGGKITGWNWDFADGNKSADKNSIHQFKKGNIYQAALTVTSENACTDKAEKPVTITDKPGISIQPVFYMYEGDILQLKPTYTGNIENYSWSPPLYLNSSNIAYPVTTPAADVSYTITASAAGPCSTAVTTSIKLEKKLDVPNVFSPNGDGINDTWRIKNLDTYANSAVQVFDRWGNAVFSSKGYNTPWNGTYNNKPLPIGTYYYVIDMHNDLNPAHKVQSGSVTIIK